ncbi:MAG: hypothetical protein FWH22_04885 [Fibromonadales bacterium]|nr:hypothetical protein [Fibromonadales bacterium]
MNKFKFIFSGLTAVFFLACSSKQIGLKENWIDERDMMALAESESVIQWMVKAGKPTLVEIIGDTSVYYYNYRPTMYAVAVYDSTTFFKTWGTATEAKPSLANATEVWGSRRNLMQIKAVNDRVVTAVVADGPDRKVFVRDLNGNIVLDPNTGFNPNISTEQRIDKSSKEFGKASSSIQGENTWPATEKIGEVPASQAKAIEAAAEAVAATATAVENVAAEEPVAEAVVAEAEAKAEPEPVATATEPAPEPQPEATPEATSETVPETATEAAAQN